MRTESSKRSELFPGDLVLDLMRRGWIYSFGEIYDRVINVWGSVSRRVVHRRLKELAERAKVERAERGWRKT
jgi:hypothetical protein